MILIAENPTILTPIVMMAVIIMGTGILMILANRGEKKRRKKYLDQFPSANRGPAFTDPTRDVW